MNFAINAALPQGPHAGHPRDEDRVHAARAQGDRFELRGEVVRMAQQVAYGRPRCAPPTVAGQPG